jgi:tetratricopeptide (TPR) repeat protein
MSTSPFWGRTNASGILSNAQASRFVIQDFRPLAESIEWELGQAYLNRGSRAFAGDEHIPFAVNNDGNLSMDSAEVVFESLLATERQGALGSHIAVLELGPGLGLFARYFLDAFRDLCRQRNTDYYDRLTYLAGDRSEKMLADISQRGVFANHLGHYELRVVDALRPDEYFRDGDVNETRFHAIFLNYVLDALPATALKLDTDGVKQLCVRTCLARGVKLTEYTDLTSGELARRANSDDSASKRELANLFHLFSSEYAYHPYFGNSQEARFAVEFARSKKCTHILHNHGAIQSLERLLGLLEPTGFILINDYGSAEAKDCEKGFVHQRYGDSVFVGLNFPLAEEYFRQRGYQWAAPSEDNGHIYSRMIGISLNSAVVERFQSVFGKSQFEWKREPANAANAGIQDGRFEAAAVAYREALQRQPYNWLLMSQAAKFLMFTLKDAQAGLQLARAALPLNPCSSELWNTLGDGLFLLERIDEARYAFQRALELESEDVRARYNLSFIFEHERNYAAALKIIAEALTLDKRGAYREGLLRKQGEILQKLASGFHQQGQRKVNRVTDLERSAHAPQPETNK